MRHFDWDENKRKINHEKHGIDFMDAVKVFDDPDRIEAESTRSGEKRIQTIGVTHGVVIFLVYIRRGNKRRIISVRRASKNERKIYEESKR